MSKELVKNVFEGEGINRKTESSVKEIKVHYIVCIRQFSTSPGLQECSLDSEKAE